MTMIELGKITEIRTGRLNANQAIEGGKYPFFTCSVNPLRIDDYAYDCECVLVAGNGDLNVKYYNGKFNAYQRVYIVESIDKSKYDVKFLYYFLQTHIDTLRRNSIGGIIKYIRLGDLTNAEVPNLTIETQRKIVSVIEKSEKALILREQQIEALSALKQSVFLQLFRENEYTDSIKLKELINSISAGLSTGGENRKKSKNEIGVLTTSAVTYGVFNPNAYRVPEKEKLLGKNLIKPLEGSILVSRMNTKEFVGAACLVENDYDDLFIPDRLWRLIPNTGLINPVYLNMVLQSKRFREQIDRISTGTSGSMQNISQKNYLNLEIPYLAIDIQDEFSRKALNINRNIEELNESLNIIKGLYQSLLHKAFKGELFKEEIKA